MGSAKMLLEIEVWVGGGRGKDMDPFCLIFSFLLLLAASLFL